MSEKGNSPQDYTQFGDGTGMSSPGVPIANQYDAQVPNESLRGAARYLGSLVNRYESDPVQSINYRASYVYNKFPTFNDVNAPEQSANVSYDLFHKILGTDNTQTDENKYTVQNSDVARLSYEPNYIARFMHSSLGVNLKESPFDANSASLVPGVKASYTSLSKNLAVNLPDDPTNRAPGQNLDYSNPASVAVIRERMFGQTAGFTLTGFSSRIQPADKTSPSPIIIGAAYTALEESVKHRSQSQIVKAIVGFQSRPDTSFYQLLLSGQTTGNADSGLKDNDGKPIAGVSLNATFFQFQNTDIIQTLYNPGISFNIVTQQLGKQDFETTDDNKVRILAGNEIILNGTQSLDTNETVLGSKQAKGINYHNSFHPKLGYVTLIKGPKTYEIAFIGTQNITAATSRHSTIESMLFVNKDGDGISGELFNQIKDIQDYFASESFSSEINRFYGEPVKSQLEGYWDITRALNSKLANSGRQYLFFNDEIFGTRFYDTSENDGGNLVTSYNSIWDKEKEIYVRDYERDYNKTLAKSTPGDKQRFGIALKEGKYVQLLERVKGGLDENGNRVISNNNLVAVVSFDYINKIADFETGGQHAFTRAIYDLAREGKVQVVMSASEYQKAMNNTLSTAVDTKLLSFLAERGALNLSVTGKHHDKSIAVFDKDTGSLKALAIGSANPTRSSIGLKRGGGGSSVIDNGGNIEVAAVIGLDNLDMINTGQLEDKQEQEFLNSLKERIQPHYFGLTGGAFNIGGFNQNRTNIAKPLGKAYKTESPALLLVKEQERVASIIKLKNALNNYTQTGSDPNSKYGSIIATLRYEPQLRSRVKYVGQGEWGQLPDGTDHPVLKGMSYTDAPIGLRITVTGPDKFHQLSFDATVTEEGNIVIPDLNKIINGAIWVNKTNSPITIFDKAPEWDKSFISKRTINPGDAGTQLTPFETLLAFAETVQRSFIYQEEFGLVDIMFRDSVREDRNKVITQIKSLFEDAFADALPEQFSFSYDKSTTVNLKTILASLSKKRIEGGTSREKDTAFISILNQVAEYMTTKTYGSSIINRASTSADARKKLIMESLIEVFNIESDKPSQLLKLDDMVADRFLRKLLIGNSVVFNDIKKQLISDIEETRAKYKSASLTQARTLLDEILSSFLAVHEETYAYYQGQERLGIFGETTSFDMYGEDSTITAQYKAGLLNPLAISHSTQVTAPGVLYRSLAATSYGDTLMLPGFGGLKQLTISDSDLSSGASVGQAFLSGMGKSSPGFSVVSKDQTKETLLLMLYQLNDIKPSEDNKLDNQDALEDSMQQVINLTFGAASQLIYTPFEKLEQLTQRIKNVVGFRPALEFSQDFAISLINLFVGDKDATQKIRKYFNIHNKTTKTNIAQFADYLESYDPNNLNSNSLLEGQLRFSMPSIQHEEVGKAIELLKASGISDPTYADVQEYFRRLLLKQGNVQHGFIGGAKYKRFALTLGTSFMGDFSYLNPDYQYEAVQGGDLRTPIYGKLHNLRIKFNPERVDNVPKTITSFIKIFGEYGAVAITEKIGDRGPGLYKINAYNQGQAVLGEQIGEFTDTGLVKLKMDLVKVYHKGNYGPRPEPITFKVPAWAKRSEGGMTYIAPSPNLVDTARTTQIIELDTYTIYRPGSSSRFGGGGLAKGPVVYLEPGVFSSITNSTTPSLLPQSFQKDSLYGLGSMGTFKGVNVETGLVLLQDNEFRSQLIKDDKQLLVSLAMLFSKDEEVKTSLIDYIRETVGDTRGAASLLLTKGVDISEATIPNKGKIDKSVSKNTLAYTASGLLMLAGQEAVTSLDFSILKKAVAEALKTDSLDVTFDIKDKDGSTKSVNINLAQNLDKLINLSTEQAYALKEGNQNFYIFNDSNQITRGLGVLAHMFYLTSQIFNPDRKTVSGLYEIGLNNQELYRGQGTQQIAGFTTEDYRSFVNQTLRAMGYTPKDIENNEKNLEYNLELMNLAQARLDNQFVIETINDNQISQSLVASGMRDVVKQEYQFYIGMMNKKLNEYRNIMGEQGVSIQQAYLEAIAVSEGDMNAMVREQTLSFRLAMSQVDTFRGGQDFSSPGAVLRYQDLRLRDLALLFSPGLIDNSSKIQRERGGVEYRRDFEGSVLNIITSFQPHHIEDSLLLMASNLNQYQEYIAEVTSAGYSKGLIAMSKLLQSQLNRRDVDINSSYGKALQTALDNLTKSQRIVLPYIEFHQTEDGRFIGAMRPVTDHNPTTGILLGSDFVSRIGQSFGDFETEIMKAQVTLVETLNRAQPVLEKFMQNTDTRKTIPVFSEHEVRLIMDLRSALDMSGRTLIDIPITDISRQYAGDHESMSGAVGIATNSFVLRPDEILLGKRYLRIAGTVDMQQDFLEQNSLVGTAINKLSNDLIKGENIKESITYLLASFGVIDSDDDYETWKSRVQTDYDTFFSKLDSAESKNFLSRTLGLSGTLSETDIAKQILFKARLYTDILGFSPLLASGAEQDIGISSQILQEIILDTVGEDFKTKDIDTILRSYRDREFKDGSFTLEKLAYLSAGFTFSRTGQPGGSSGIDSESNEFTAIHAYKYLQRIDRISEKAALIKVDLDRLSTGVIVPSNSRLISGLGDYDGDSYRLTMKQITATEQSLDPNSIEQYAILQKKKRATQQDLNIYFKLRDETTNKLIYKDKRTFYDASNLIRNLEYLPSVGDDKSIKTDNDPYYKYQLQETSYSFTDEKYDYAKSIITQLLALDPNTSKKRFRSSASASTYIDIFEAYKTAYNNVMNPQQGIYSPLSEAYVSIGDDGYALSQDVFDKTITVSGQEIKVSDLLKLIPTRNSITESNANLYFSSLLNSYNSQALRRVFLSNKDYGFIDYLDSTNDKSKHSISDFFGSLSNDKYNQVITMLEAEGIYIAKRETTKNDKPIVYYNVMSSKAIESVPLNSTLLDSYNETYHKLYKLNLIGLDSLDKPDDYSFLDKESLKDYSTILGNISKGLRNYRKDYFYRTTDTFNPRAYLPNDSEILSKVTAEIQKIEDSLAPKTVRGNTIVPDNYINDLLINIKQQFHSQRKESMVVSNLIKLIDDLNESIKNQNSIAGIKQHSQLLNLMYYLSNSIDAKTNYQKTETVDYLHTKLFDLSNNLINQLSSAIGFDYESDKNIVSSSILREHQEKIKQDDEIYKQLDSTQSLITDLINQNKKVQEEINLIEIPTILTGLNPAERYKRKQEARRLKDLERFLKSYTNLPAFMFSKVGGNPRLTTGELIGFISQKYDFGNIEDAKKFTQSSIIQTLIVRANTEDLEQKIKLTDITDKTLKTIIKDTLKTEAESITVEELVNKMGIKTREVDKEGKKTNNVTNIAKVTLATLKAYHDDSDTSFMDTFSRVQQVTQQSQGLDVIDKKLLGRHLNTLLTPEEFTVATSVIGLAGTDLIGRAYNTLIPLLDTITIEQSFMYSQVSKHMKTALNNDKYKHLRSQLGVVIEGDDLEAARQYRIKIRNRFAGTLSVLSNFQQIVRDAIKAKEGGSILERFHEYTNYGEDVNSLLNILTSSLEDGESSHAQEKRMRNAMSSFLKTSMGPQLDTNNDIENTIHNRLFSINPKHQKDTFSHILDVSEAVTGFGALYYLDSYARTEQNENLYEKFITNSLFGDQSEYFKDWAKTQLGSQKDGQPIDVNTIDWSGTEYKHLLRNFIGKQIIDLMQRTQVSFSISSMKEENVSIMFKHLQKMVETFENNLKTDSDLQDKKVARKIEGQVLYSLEQFTGDDIKKLLGIETLTESKKNLVELMKNMDAEYEKMNQDEIAQQFRKQYEIYKIYEELASEDGADQKKLQYQAVASMMLEQMKYRDETYNVLTNDTIEYLRYAAIDLSLMTSEDVASLGAENKIKLASRFAYTQMLRGLRSGKITDTATALEASQFKLGSVLAVLNENGITINDLFGESESFNKTELQKLIDNQERFGMAYVEEGQQVSDETKEGVSRLSLTALLGSMVYTTGLDEEANKELLKFMISSHQVGENGQGEVRTVTGFQLIAEQSAGLATLEKLTQTRQRAYEAGDYTLAEAIDARLESYRSSDSSDFNTFNNPTLLDINDYDLDTALAKQAEDNVQKIIAETQENIINKQDDDNKRRLGVMQSAPIAGILAGPLLFALASSDLKMDERVAMFAYDVFQGAAELSTRPNTTYSQYVGTQAQGTYGFRMARIGQSMQTYGYMYGAGIGLSSELMYRGIGELADVAIGATLGRRVAMSPNLGAVGAAAAAEVLAAVLSQAVTRAITGKIAKQVKKDYEEQQDYAAIKQRLSKERLEAYNQQGEAQLNVYDLDKGYNVAVVEEFDRKRIDYISDEEINDYTNWYLALYNPDGAEITTVFEDPTDPHAYTTADQLRA